VAAPAAKAQTSASRWWRRTYPKHDPFARRRRRQALVLLAIAAAVQVLAWVLVPSLGLRLGVLGITVLVLPVVRVLLFDRR
jgi:Flp pilus assembly protein TadB